MWPRTLHEFKSTVHSGIANRQLRHQMIPLMLNLPAAYRDEPSATRATDLTPGERVPATRALRMDPAKIVGERAKRGRLSSESFQLRVVQVPIRLTSEYGLGQEPFSPQCDKPSSIEVFRMHGPETHSSAHPSSIVRPTRR